MGRIISHTTMHVEDITPEMLGPETVVVYQTDSGKQVIRIDCSPAQISGQNFALSPDGMNLAVMRNGAIEIYGLPPLTEPEQKAVQVAMSAAPEDTGAAIRLGAAASSGNGTASETSGTAETATAAENTAPAANAPQPPAPDQTAPDQTTPEQKTPDQKTADAAGAKQEGDASADEAQKPRKPPTLYNEPGESGAPVGNSSGQPASKTSEPQ